MIRNNDVVCINNYGNQQKSFSVKNEDKIAPERNLDEHFKGGKGQLRAARAFEDKGWEDM